MILYITDINIRVDDADNQISYNYDLHFDEKEDPERRTDRRK